MNFGQMLLYARMELQDLKVNRVLEAQLARSINEGKNELTKLIRQAREDWFLTTTTGTVSSTTAPNASSITLPSDFAELKEFMVTESGKEHISFRYLDRSDRRFKDALIAGGDLRSGWQDGFYYDLVGVSTMVFAPGFDVNTPYQMTYIATVADMTKRSESPSLLPAEHHDFIVTWAAADVLRSLADNRLVAYESKLEFQRQSVINAVNATDIKEPRFVTGFDEQWEAW